MTRHSPFSRSASVSLGVVLAAGGAACGSTTKASSTRAPAAVQIEGTDHGIVLPATIPGGIVPVRITDKGHDSLHLIFLRLDHGVSFQQLMAAGPNSAGHLATVAAGNGGLTTGQAASLIFDLRPGRYGVLNIGDHGPGRPQLLTVTTSTGTTARPSATGTIVIPSGTDRYTMPAEFSGHGTYEVVNQDSEPHEASIIKLAPGKSATDFVAWYRSKQGPPAGERFGGFGALGPGRHGWMTLDLAPGSYALACFVPGRNGVPHVLMGMIKPFTVATS